MPTFKEVFGTGEAQRIAFDSFRKVTRSDQPVSYDGTLKDYGINTSAQRDLLLNEVDSEVRHRGFKINQQYLRILDLDSNVSSLLEGILSSLPGDEDFGEPSEDVTNTRSPFKRKRP